MAWFRCSGIPQSILDLKTVSSASGSIATFDTDLTDNLIKCVADIQALQTGTGTPSSQNVRLISGYSSIKIAKSSKNLFGGFVFMPGCTIESTGAISTSVNYDIYKISIKKNTDYTISFREASAGNRASRLAIYNGNTFVDIVVNSYTSAGEQSYTVNFNQDFDTAFLVVRNTCYNIQLEEGSTATTYEAPQITTIPLGQTVYGGNLDVLSGVLTIDKGYIEFDGSSDEDWSYATGNKWATIVIPDMKSGANQDGITNWLPKSTSYQNYGFALGRNNTSFYAYQIQNISGVTDLATWKTYISSNPLQVVYPLATPTTVQLSSNQIATILGQNNIYADTGDIEVKYLETVGNKIGA